MDLNHNILEQINNITLFISDKVNSIFFGENVKSNGNIDYEFIKTMQYNIGSVDTDLEKFYMEQREKYRDSSIIIFNTQNFILFNTWEIGFNGSQLFIKFLNTKHIMNEGEMMLLNIIYSNRSLLKELLHRYRYIYDNISNTLLADNTGIVKHLLRNFEHLLDTKIQIPLGPQIHKALNAQLLSDKLKGNVMFIRFSNSDKNHPQHVKYVLYLEEHAEYDGKYTYVDEEIFVPENVEILKEDVIYKPNLNEFLVNLFNYGKI